MKTLALGLMGATLFAATPLFAFTETRLNDDAVRDGSGNLLVYGTSASAAYSKEMAFDGNPDTFFDAGQSAGTWCGLQMKTPKILTRVTYRARSDTYQWGYGRMIGCKIQGANKSDFSDAVTLLTIAPPDDWVGATYAEQKVATTTAYTFFRLYAPDAYDSTKCTACCGGNVSELNFYGDDAPTPFEDVLLNDCAVTNASGALVVLGTGPSNDYAKEKAFDNDPTTFFDGYQSANQWCGLQMQTPKILTRVSYRARTDTYNYGYGRMKGCFIQGANNADFSDAVTLLTIDPPSGWVGTTYAEQYVTNPVALSTPFTYFRLLSPEVFDSVNTPNPCCGGNVAELRFYGNDLPTDPETPQPPALNFADAINALASVRIVRSTAINLYELFRQYAGEDDWTSLGRVVGCTTASVWIHGNTSTDRAATYRVRAYVPGGATADTDVAVGTFHALKGTASGTSSSSTTYGYATVWDGKPETFFDASSASDAWTGLDLGETRTITGLRYVKREGGDGPRIRNAYFQVATVPDYSDAVTFYTAPSTTPDFKVVTATLETPVAGRYVRYHSPTSGYGNIAECEFDSTPHPLDGPANLTATYSDLTNQYARLTWTPDAVLVDETVVWRATSATGPWEKMTTLPSATGTWTDASVVLGVKYWYALSHNRCEGGTTYEGARGASVTYRRMMRLERDWSNLGALKSGVTLIKACDTATTGYGLGSAGNLFDGLASTFADIYVSGVGDAGWIRVGVDLGTKYAVGMARVLPRQNGDGSTRAPNYQLFGADDYSSWAGTGVIPKMAFSGYSQGEFASTNTTPYRAFWLNKPEGNGYMNIAELELYGWPENVLQAPTDLTLAHTAAGVNLAWTGCAGAVSYRVERAAETDEAWTVLATVTDVTYEDATAPRDGSGVRYRIVAVDAGSSELASEAKPFVSYAPGAGTGLRSVSTWPWYHDTYATPQAVVTGLTANLNCDWGTGTLIPGVSDATDNVGISWTAKLIVPYDGVYTFSCDAATYFYLSLDGVCRLNCWGLSSAATNFVANLTAGEHILRAEYGAATGTARCRLRWSGPVTEEIIPQSQFVPLEPADISPWEGNRTFGSILTGEASVEADGSILIHSFTDDLGGTVDRYHYLWQRLRGNFDARITVENLGTGSKVMLMARASLASGAPFIGPCTDGKPYKFGIKRRMTTGAGILDATTPWTDSTTTKATLRLVREGNVFTSYWRKPGDETWNLLESFTFADGAFGDEIFIGPATTHSFDHYEALSSSGHRVTKFRTQPSGLVILVR